MEYYPPREKVHLFVIQSGCPAMNDRRLNMTQDSTKVAIVTGASRGIGAAVAERLAGDGFTVVINYSASDGSAETLLSEIEAKGGGALAVRADVSDADAMRGMFDGAERAFGRVDVLVNNSGIMKLA